MTFQWGLLLVSGWPSLQSGSFFCRSKSHRGPHNRNPRAIRTILWNGWVI